LSFALLGKTQDLILTMHGLEPYGYLNRILKALPYADTVEKVEMLLPWNFKSE
jgi:hypothetical protein